MPFIKKGCRNDRQSCRMTAQICQSYPNRLLNRLQQHFSTVLLQQALLPFLQEWYWHVYCMPQADCKDRISFQGATEYLTPGERHLPDKQRNGPITGHSPASHVRVCMAANPVALSPPPLLPLPFIFRDALKSLLLSITTLLGFLMLV